MYLTQLRAFHAVARCGGFTIAAEKLSLSQPSVSEHVRTLEKDFGVLLFDRHKRLVKPTALGLELLAITDRLFETEQEAMDLSSEVQGLKRGFLSIGADGPAYVMDLIGRYREKYPGITINLNTGNSSQVHAQLLDKRVDAPISGPMPEDDRRRRLIRRILWWPMLWHPIHGLSRTVFLRISRCAHCYARAWFYDAAGL